MTYTSYLEDVGGNLKIERKKCGIKKLYSKGILKYIRRSYLFSSSSKSSNSRSK